jgi:hypothetical protein
MTNLDRTLGPWTAPGLGRDRDRDVGNERGHGRHQR